MRTVLTKAQRRALHTIWQRHPQNQSYMDFRRAVFPTFAMDSAVTVKWCGMWLLIETDGYAHS